MSNKSYVSLEQKACPVSGEIFETNSILFDKTMRESLDKNTITGFEIHPDVQEQLDKGFVALVEIDPTKSEKPYTPNTAWRTGQIAYVRREMANDMFNIPVGKSEFVYVEIGILTRLQEIQEEDDDND